MKALRVTCVVWAVFLGVGYGFAAKASTDDAAVHKTVKTLINAVRYGKNDLAAKQLSFSGMAEGLLAKEWSSLSAAQKQEFVSLLEKLIRGISFPKGKDMFQHLDAVLLKPSAVQKDKASCVSTVVVNRQYKKADIAIEWVLVREQGVWKVVDTRMMGESTTEGIREDQLEPLLDQGGMEQVLKAMRKRAAEVSRGSAP